MYSLNLTLSLQLTIILTLTLSLTPTLHVKVFTRCGAKAAKSKPGKLTTFSTGLGVAMQRKWHYKVKQGYKSAHLKIMIDHKFEEFTIRPYSCADINDIIITFLTFGNHQPKNVSMHYATDIYLMFKSCFS